MPGIKDFEDKNAVVTGIKVSPGFQMWPTYFLKRLSPTVYQGISRLFFKYLLFRDSR